MTLLSQCSSNLDSAIKSPWIYKQEDFKSSDIWCDRKGPGSDLEGDSLINILKEATSFFNQTDWTSEDLSFLNKVLLLKNRVLVICDHVDGNLDSLSLSLFKRVDETFHSLFQKSSSLSVVNRFWTVFEASSKGAQNEVLNLFIQELKEEDRLELFQHKSQLPAGMIFIHQDPGPASIPQITHCSLLRNREQQSLVLKLSSKDKQTNSFSLRLPKSDVGIAIQFLILENFCDLECFNIPNFVEESLLYLRKNNCSHDVQSYALIKLFNWLEKSSSFSSQANTSERLITFTKSWTSKVKIAQKFSLQHEDLLNIIFQTHENLVRLCLSKKGQFSREQWEALNFFFLSEISHLPLSSIPQHSRFARALTALCGQLSAEDLQDDSSLSMKEILTLLSTKAWNYDSDYTNKNLTRSLTKELYAYYRLYGHEEPLSFFIKQTKHLPLDCLLTPVKMDSREKALLSQSFERWGVAENIEHLHCSDRCLEEAFFLKQELPKMKSLRKWSLSGNIFRDYNIGLLEDLLSSVDLTKVCISIYGTDIDSNAMKLLECRGVKKLEFVGIQPSKLLVPKSVSHLCFLNCCLENLKLNEQLLHSLPELETIEAHKSSISEKQLNQLYAWTNSSDKHSFSFQAVSASGEVSHKKLKKANEILI